ncbi:hypothetical protein B0H11DRAFT_1905899 [Mycena galericulata]|nr:hypothetical protein B0H11DRAFT_1905899 [Mycena galericulata]
MGPNFPDTDENGKVEVSFGWDEISRSSDYDDCLFLALLLNGFHAPLRLGERKYPDEVKLGCAKSATASYIQGAYSYMLSGHKADGFVDGNKILKKGPWDPYAPFISFPASRDNLHPYHCRFCFPSEIAG